MEQAQRIRLVVINADGVLDESLARHTAAGQTLYSFHARDRSGLVLLLRSGIGVAVITAGAAERYARHLAEPLLKCHRSAGRPPGEVYAAVCTEHGAANRFVCYVGSDLPDLAPMARAGLAVAVADAALPVREAAHYVARCRAGLGAVREVAELILKSQGKWRDLVARWG